MIKIGSEIEFKLAEGREYIAGSIGRVIAIFTVGERDCYTVQFPDESTTYAFECEFVA